MWKMFTIKIRIAAIFYLLILITPNSFVATLSVVGIILFSNINT